MKPFQHDSVKVSIVRKDVYLVLTDSKGGQLIFEPPRSSVKQQWCDDMRALEESVGWVRNRLPESSGQYLVTLEHVNKTRLTTVSFWPSTLEDWNIANPYYKVVGWKRLPEPCP